MSFPSQFGVKTYTFKLRFVSIPCVSCNVSLGSIFAFSSEKKRRTDPGFDKLLRLNSMIFDEHLTFRELKGLYFKRVFARAMNEVFCPFVSRFTLPCSIFSVLIF